MSCYTCDSCLALSFAWCEDMEFILGLTANTTYYAIVEAPNGIKYTQTVTSNAIGSITIDITPFPDGLFNPYAGIFTLTVEDTGHDEVTLVHGYSDYTCVSFDIYDLQDAN